jgi:hypothetical protein
VATSMSSDKVAAFAGTLTEFPDRYLVPLNFPHMRRSWHIARRHCFRAAFWKRQHRRGFRGPGTHTSDRRDNYCH